MRSASSKFVPLAPFKSSHIKTVHYDESTGDMLVAFSDDRQYMYAGVPAGVWKALDEAESKGKFLNSEIVNTYAYRVIPNLVINV